MTRIPAVCSQLILLIVFAVSVEAQTMGQLRGRVVATDGAPLAGASVAARSLADSTRVTGSVTGQDGSFRIVVPAGEYRVTVSHLGYQEQSRQASVSAAEPTELGTIEVTTAAVAIEGVTVESERATVVMQPDRTVYRTADMPAIQGGVATDALRSVPELDVDLEGKLTLRGATPRVHINGRPTPMQGEALQQFLQQLPADRIERIEVMPNPSARYEAEGAGGIVNIVMKSNASLGLSGSLGATAGTRGRTGGFGNLAYQEGRLTLFGNGSFNLQRRDYSNYDLRQNLLAEPTTFREQRGEFGNRGYWSRGDLTAEFQLSKRSTAWASASAGGFGSESEGISTFTMMDEVQNPTERFARSSTGEWSRSNTDGSLGLKHVVEEGKHEVSAEVRRSLVQGGNEGRYLVQLHDLSGGSLPIPPELLLSDDGEEETRTWVKTDYERPVGETRVQIGLQSNFQSTRQDQLRETFPFEGSPDPTVTQRSDFRYEETFHQAYVSLTRKLGKLSLQGGVRAERAFTDFILPGTGETFDNEYTSFFPNANVGYDLGSGRRIGASYSRRIQRPWIWFLNPLDRSIDPLTRQVGNPRLRPQYTHSFGTDLSWNGARGNLRLAPYYRVTENGWDQITTADAAGVLTTTWENVVSTSGYGAQLSAMMRSTGKLSGNVGVGVHREIRDASNLSADFSGRSFRYNANGNLTLAVNRTLNLQGMLWYNSPQELPQGRRSAFVMSSVGLRQQLFNNKVTMNLRLEDPFELARYDFQTRDRTHVLVARNQFSQRSATLNLSYNFGRRPRSVRRPTSEEPAQPPEPGIGVMP